MYMGGVSIRFGSKGLRLSKSLHMYIYSLGSMTWGCLHALVYTSRCVKTRNGLELLGKDQSLGCKDHFP